MWRRVSKQSIRARLKNSLATYVTHLSTNDKPETSVSFKFDEICDSETCREVVGVPRSPRESDLPVTSAKSMISMDVEFHNVMKILIVIKYFRSLKGDLTFHGGGILKMLNYLFFIRRRLANYLSVNESSIDESVDENFVSKLKREF